MKPLGVSAGLLLGVLLALTVGVQTRAYADKDDSTFSNKSLKGNFAFHLRPSTSFAPFYDGDVNAGPTVGRNSGVYGAPRQDILRVGVFTANGNGGLTGRTIATTDDGAVTVIIDFNFSGTYTVNSDGTGNLSISCTTVNSRKNGDGVALTADGCAPDEGTETYAFVLSRNEDAKTVSLIQTDNSGGGAKIFLAGDARRQHGD